jgi:hypothetical protein
MKGISLSTKLGKCTSVVLSEGQAEYASEIGRQRTAAAKNEKHRDGVREPRSWDEREKYDIMAAKGEMWGCIWGQKAWEVGRWQEYGTSGRHWMFVDKEHLMPITHLTDEYDKDIDNWAQELADLPKT